MKIDTEGVYTLQYTAEDECGNVTVEERTVSVENITYRTVLYTDGTFIINEKSSDIDANIALHGAVIREYAPLLGNTNYVFSSAAGRPWNNQVAQIKNVIDGSGVYPTSTQFWFQGCVNIESVDIDTSQTTNMGNMFNNCSTTTSITLGSRFDTSNVTNMGSMFKLCNAAISLNLGNKFDTSKVTRMNGMFATCRALTSLDLGNKFDTSNVTNMNLMFNGCQALTSLDLGDKFDTSKVTDMGQMFSGCQALASLDLGDKFDTSKVTFMYTMFGNCSALTSLDLGDKFDTSSVRENYYMFSGASQLVTIFAPTVFSIDHVYNSKDMFENCRSLVGGAGTVYNNSNPKDKTYAHIDGGTANPGYFTARP